MLRPSPIGMLILAWAGLAAGNLAAASPPVPETPAAVMEVLQIQEFTLQTPYQTDWRKERPWVHHGTFLVLKVNPDLVYPRQSAEPVLYAGDQTAERINGGYPSGILVVIVPGKLDLDTDLIWFGSPELPERVDLDLIRREQERALAAKITPLGKPKVAESAKNEALAGEISPRDAAQGGEALAVGQGATLALRDRHALLGQAGSLILRHDPGNERLGQDLLRLKDTGPTKRDFVDERQPGDEPGKATHETTR